MTPVFDLTCCPSPFVPESELSHNVEAHHGLVPKLGHHEWKNPASLKNHSFQYIAVMSGCAAGFLGFSSEDVLVAQQRVMLSGLVRDLAHRHKAMTAARGSKS